LPNFAKSTAAVVRTTSLEAQAQQIALTSPGRKEIDVLSSQPIPDNIMQSMTAQGMAYTTAWGPGVPIHPVQAIGEEPRQFEYMIGQNIVQRPRSTEAVSFETMRAVIENYDVAQMAIEVRQDELRNLDWDIVPYDEEDADKYESEIKAIRAFFEKPGGGLLFDEMQNMLAYDWLAFDALALYVRFTRGGKIGALEPVDGTTITPLVDWYGRTPEPPAPAYVQWVSGMPWVWLDKDHLIYKPHRRRSNKIYGFAPVEWMLLTINTDVRHQLYFLQYFTEGSVPEAWMEAPPDVKDPKQIKQLQDMYDAVMSGDQSKKHKVKFVPFGSKVTQARDVKFDIHFPQFMLQKACAAWKVTPAELGFTEKVNKSSGETQENVQYRRSIKPSAKYFSSIYTGIIHKFFGMPHLYFKFLNLEEQEDLLLMAQRDEIYIRNAVISPDEIRAQRLGLDVDKNHLVPRGFLTAKDGFIPIEDAIKKSRISTQQLESQVDAARASAGETPLYGDPKEENAAEADSGVEATIREEEEAEKAVMDFFRKADGGHKAHPHAGIQKWIDKFAPKVHAFLKAKRKHIVSQIRHHLEHLGFGKEANPSDPLPGQADSIINGYTAPGWNKDLTRLLQDMLVAIYLSAMSDAADQLDMETSDVFHSQAMLYAQSRAAELVTGLDQSTRDMLRGDLASMMQEGLSPSEIAQELEDHYAFSESRALTIARTETAFAWNHGALTMYQQSGVPKVRVYDGDHDPECQQADGEVWTIEYALLHRIQHPNCVRSFAPELEDVEPDRGADGDIYDDETDSMAAKDKGKRNRR
jgi:hypothetical protein